MNGRNGDCEFSQLRLVERSGKFEGGLGFWIFGIPAGSMSMITRTGGVILVLIAQMCFAMGQGQSPSIVGRWNVEIAFADGNKRLLRFDAQGGGKGSFELLDPRAKAWGAPTHFEAKWTSDNEDIVTFTGPVEFMLGNVGRDAGALTCKGKFEGANLITGDVDFAPLVGERPSKHGTFKAVRDNSAH